ncbi:MAG: excinuclease ABC subunit UvrB [Bacteroidia bacterium]|nr:excinuclease ABC subunit UvrB [Bacteroidia bacterium]MDW8236622.1 excinuclease ABC subunit UvrB [Bacteroidia bacterium]
MRFRLETDLVPRGDQPQAIEELAQGIQCGEPHQVLLGVTGSGKTFTIANVIARVQMPTLVLSHNKTLTWQLYSEFRRFFPHNLVCYWISHYDYYQPEAYLPETDTYIAKELSILSEIERYRLETLTALVSGRRDVLVVASVSAIYGLSDPKEFAQQVLTLKVGRRYPRQALIQDLIQLQYRRVSEGNQPGTFWVRGDRLFLFPPYTTQAYRISFLGPAIDGIEEIDNLSFKSVRRLEELQIFAANMFVLSPDKLERALQSIQAELEEQVKYLLSLGKVEEATRLRKRTLYDIEQMRTLGYCNGIENYARHLTGRAPGERPYTLLDYFSRPFLTVIDESHVTVPQVKAMIGGDQSRKLVLVEYGFRLPSALDNRPLRLEEFEELLDQVIYVSATPGPYEMQKTGGAFVEQVVRPTGLMDPPVHVHPMEGAIDHLLEVIRRHRQQKGRALVITLTKKLAEEVADFLSRLLIPSAYLHSDLNAIQRVEIIDKLRKGEIEVIVGVNLLREGLDLPEVSLVAILEADKEGFLRSETSLIQIAGRAARNVQGEVILYADGITDSMQRFMREAERRRQKQLEYNAKHGIVPRSAGRAQELSMVPEKTEPKVIEVPGVASMTISELQALIEESKRRMLEAAEAEEYLTAARYRDEMRRLEELLHQRLGAAATSLR